jgi:regulatory protein
VVTDAAQPDPEAELQVALEQSFRYLAHRDRTVVEVRANLERRGAGEAVIDAAVEELVRMGYVDDARFARQFAEDRRKLDAWGSERIERRLTALGVSREHVHAALAGDDHDDLAAAVALLERRFPTPPATPRERDRALGHLVRKGYELELAHDALRRHAGATLD